MSKVNEISIVINALEKILSAAESRFDWEDLLSIQFDDVRAEAIRQLCWQISDAFHGEDAKIYSSGGMDILKAILEALKKEQSAMR